MGGALSIFVACLGLLGLASYNIQRRTKELGVRKVMGASGIQLFFLLTSSFTKQVVVAFVIAAPLSWYAMREWLKTFEYRVSLQPWVFLLAGGIAFLIAVLTVSHRAFRAARANPIQSLKQE